MNRRQHVQYPSALYHVTSRGVRRGDLYLDDVDHPLHWPWSSYPGYCDPYRRVP
jgi:hypothetical protein